MTKTKNTAHSNTTDLVPQGPSALASAKAADAAALAALMADDVGAGFEEATRDAFAIPFLRVLQDLSPQVKKKMAGYVEGARPGMVFNTATKELFEEVRVVPCYYTQAFIEWVPRDAKGGASGGGKGFVAAHPANTPLVHKAVREGSKNVLPNGNELSDTRQHFVLYQRADGSWDQALIALSGSQIKKSKAWMTNARAPHPDLRLPDGRVNPQPPLFGSVFTVHGREEEANDQGSWHTWTFEERTPVTDPDLYRQAKEFCKSMRDGKGRVAYDEMEEHTTTGRGSGAPRDLHDENEIDA